MDVAALIVLNRPFPFVLIIGEILEKIIINSESENSEIFGNNNTDSNVPRAFARI
jgi:hypothetical protein